MDTLAVRLTLPTAKRVADFHRQVIAHVGRTTKKAAIKCDRSLDFIPSIFPVHRSSTFAEPLHQRPSNLS